MICSNENNNIKCLFIPSSVSFVSTSDFADCKDIEKIVFKGNIKLFPETFCNCRSLKEICFEGKADFETLNNLFDHRTNISFLVNDKTIKFSFTPTENHMVYINDVPDFEGTAAFIDKLFKLSKDELLSIIEEELCIGLYTSFFILRVLETAYGKDKRIDELFPMSYSSDLEEYIRDNNLTEDLEFIKSHMNM